MMKKEIRVWKVVEHESKRRAEEGRREQKRDGITEKRQEQRKNRKGKKERLE